MEKCDFPKCKGISYVNFLGVEICPKHWDKLCESNGDSENRILKKIGLVRDKEGSVVPITKK